MPVADVAEARDLVYGVLNTAWTAQMSPPPITYHDQRKERPNHAPYAEAIIEHLNDHGVAIGDSGRKRIRDFARLVVSIYTVPGDGLTASDAYVKIVRNAFEQRRNTAPDQVAFRRVTEVEDGVDGDAFKVRVIVYFDYDRIQSRT